MRIARSHFGPTNVSRYSTIGIAAHGKGVSDALGNLAQRNLSTNVRSGKFLGTTARDCVVHARNYPRIQKQVNINEGMWAPDCLYYLNYPDNVMDK